MATIATLSSSPSVPSRTDAVLDHVTKRLISHGPSMIDSSIAVSVAIPVRNVEY